MRVLASAFIAESALIGWRNLHNDKTLPPPSQLTGAAIIFGVLGLAPDSWSKAAGAFAWAFVLATFLNLWNPATPLNLIPTAATGTKSTPPASQALAPGRTGTGQQPAGPA